MSASDFADRFVVLRGGLILPAAPYVLLLELEQRGVHIEADGKSVVVGPPTLITDDDRTAIRRWKWHLLLLLDYCQRPGLDAHLFTDTAPSGVERHA